MEIPPVAKTTTILALSLTSTALPHMRSTNNSTQDLVARHAILQHNVAVMVSAVLASAYICGVLFGVVWILTREYDTEAGPPWVPSIFRTEALCVLFEPLVYFWPAILWPVFLLYCLFYFTADKMNRATTCCGRPRSIAKERARRQSMNGSSIGGTSSSSDVELAAARPLRSLISLGPCPTPPPAYQSRNPSIIMRKLRLDSTASSIISPRSSRSDSTTVINKPQVQAQGKDQGKDEASGSDNSES